MPMALSAVGGEDGFGELGQDPVNPGFPEYYPEPMLVLGVAAAIRVSIGWRHSCVLLADGTVAC
jgi:hypothetical protein